MATLAAREVLAVPGSSSHALLGLLIALGTLGALTLLLRWAYGGAGVPPRPRRRHYGLLVAVASVPAVEAGALRARLAEHGIRATTAAGDVSGVLDVLVFGSDEVRARALLTPSS